MNPPPIPPKSNNFEDCGDEIYAVFLEDQPCLDALNDYRDVVAAVAEVEWRRRAERWGKVLRFDWGRSRAMKIREAMLAEQAALENANAWRAWGEQ